MSLPVCTLPSFLCLQCHLLYEQPCLSHVEQVVMSCFASIQSRGNFPPRAPSPLVTCNLAIVNSPRPGIGNAWKETTSVFGDSQQHHSTECSARCHVRASSSPPPGFDSDRVKLQKIFVPLNIRNKWSRVSRLFEGTENSERWSNSRAKQNHN